MVIACFVYGFICNVKQKDVEERIFQSPIQFEPHSKSRNSIKIVSNSYTPNEFLVL